METDAETHKHRASGRETETRRPRYTVRREVGWGGVEHEPVEEAEGGRRSLGGEEGRQGF